MSTSKNVKIPLEFAESRERKRAGTDEKMSLVLEGKAEPHLTNPYLV